MTNLDHHWTYVDACRKTLGTHAYMPTDNVKSTLAYDINLRLKYIRNHPHQTRECTRPLNHVPDSRAIKQKDAY